MVWRGVATAALLLVSASSAPANGAPEEAAACAAVMARLESVRWWCLQPRLPGHVVNSVRACLQREDFSREATGAWAGRDQLLIGLSSRHVPGALNSSSWSACRAEDGWSDQPKAYFGTVALEGEDSGQHEYRLWYAAESRYQCWERTYKKALPRVDARQRLAEPYLYECARCIFPDTDGDSDEEEEEKKYSYIWGFNSTLYRRHKCASAKHPYVPALYRVRREAASCFECLLWSELRATRTVYLGRCWANWGDDRRLRAAPGEYLTSGNRTRACRSYGAVCSWVDVAAAVQLPTQAPDVIPLPSVSVRKSPEEAAPAVGVQEALAALDPRNFQPGVARAGGAPSPQALLSCLDTVLAESASISQAQIGQSLRGFELYAATVPLDGTAKSGRPLALSGGRASLLVAERVGGALVAAGGDRVAAIRTGQEGGSAAALAARWDVTAAVVSPAASAARLAFTFFRRAAVGRAFHQPGYRLNSDVLSVQIINASSGGAPYVELVLRPARGGVRRRCGQWDLERAAWDFSRCSLQLQGQVGDVCRCRHLTHFAQLVTDADVQWGGHSAALELLSLAGVCASLLGAAGLAAAAAMDAEWRAKPGSRVLLQLGAAVAARDLLLAVVTVGGRGWWQPRASVGCVVLGVALHYSLLAAAAWTTAAALLQLLRLSTIAGAQARVPHVVLVCSACSWLSPLVPVAALLSASGPTAGYPLRQDSASDYLCYPQGTAFYTSVLLPTALCIVVNGAIFLYLLFTVLFPPCTGGSSVVVTRHGPSQLQRRALTAVMLFFLLGLPWLLGPPARVPALAYLFCIVATPQGLVLFVFFVLCNSKLRKRLSSTVMTSLPSSSSWRSSSSRKQRRRRQGPAGTATPATSSSGVAASSEGGVRSRGHRKPSGPGQKPPPPPPVLLTRYALVGEDGAVRYTFDLGAWAPDDGNPTDAAYMPRSPERRSATKYVFPEPEPEPESDREGDQ